MKNGLQEKSSDKIFYSTPKGDIGVEVIYGDETFWLSQKRMSALFGVEVNTINYYTKEILRSGELKEVSTVRKIRIVQKDAGTISASIAKKLAEEEYDKFRIEQDQKYESDFDSVLRKLTKNKK